MEQVTLMVLHRRTNAFIEFILGKSNLMDALSFVLGISGQHLRSSNLKELIYHHGLANATGPTGAPLDEDVQVDKENTVSGNYQVEKNVLKKGKRNRREQEAEEPSNGGGSLVHDASAETACVSAHYESSNGSHFVFKRK